MCRKLGVTEQQLKDLVDFERSSSLTALQKLVLRYTVLMTRTPVDVPDEVFDDLKRHFNSRQIVELTSLIAWANYRARFVHALDLQSEGFSEGAFCPMPEKVQIPAGV